VTPRPERPAPRPGLQGAARCDGCMHPYDPATASTVEAPGGIRLTVCATCAIDPEATAIMRALRARS
jgi:hypothetical protein